MPLLFKPWTLDGLKYLHALILICHILEALLDVTRHLTVTEILALSLWRGWFRHFARSLREFSSSLSLQRNGRHTSSNESSRAMTVFFVLAWDMARVWCSKALQLRQRKVTIVISPLKSLQKDQVSIIPKSHSKLYWSAGQAAEGEAKGLKAIFINEYNSSPLLWVDIVTGHVQLVYVSPKMTLSNSFQNLWKETTFCKCVTAIIIDEAHCINEWGWDNFWPQLMSCNCIWGKRCHLLHAW